MNDYVPRSEISPIDRIAPRPVVAVTPVQPVAASSGQSAPDINIALRPPVKTPVQAAAQSGDGADMASASEEQLASAAEYARVHAQIADILAAMNSNAGAPVQASADAEGAVESLLPTPIIIVPLPPASKDMVEHAAHVAQQVADQASRAHAAQAHVKSGTVDQILAAVA